MGTHQQPADRVDTNNRVADESPLPDTTINNRVADENPLPPYQQRSQLRTTEDQPVKQVEGCGMVTRAIMVNLLISRFSS
jgi:hypothetical protein